MTAIEGLKKVPFIRLLCRSKSPFRHGTTCDYRRNRTLYLIMHSVPRVSTVYLKNVNKLHSIDNLVKVYNI